MYKTKREKEGYNRNYVLERTYFVEDAFQVSKDISELTGMSARLNVVFGSKFIKVYVYCRHPNSLVYRTADLLGFIEC